MQLLRTEAPLIYMIIKTLWDVICTCTISAVVMAVILLAVWLLNRAKA